MVIMLTIAVIQTIGTLPVQYTSDVIYTGKVLDAFDKIKTVSVPHKILLRENEKLKET